MFGGAPRLRKTHLGFYFTWLERGHPPYGPRICRPGLARSPGTATLITSDWRAVAGLFGDSWSADLIYKGRKEGRKEGAFRFLWG